MEEGELEDKCIVDHPGFEVCCLNNWVLEIASVGLKHDQRDLTAQPEHRRMVPSPSMLFSMN